MIKFMKMWALLLCSIWTGSIYFEMEKSAKQLELIQQHLRILDEKLQYFEDVVRRSEAE